MSFLRGLRAFPSCFVVKKTREQGSGYRVKDSFQLPVDSLQVDTLLKLDPAIKSQDYKPFTVISKVAVRLRNLIRFLPAVEMTSYATRQYGQAPKGLALTS